MSAHEASTVIMGVLVFLAVFGVCGVAAWVIMWVHDESKKPAQVADKPKQPEAPQSRGWSMHDRQGLQAFLGSPSGKRFLERLRATEYALAVAGAKDVMHTAHSAGVTVGYGDCIKHIESLSYTSDAQEEKTNDSGGQGEARPIEREAAEWAARMSP